MPGKVFDQHRLGETGWAFLTSANGQIKVPVARMDALNENTVWTWNAIGKKRGAWALSPDAPEANEGFLLNHLINELLPARGDGRRWANSDPVTGQAAWFDLRVKIEQAPPGDFSEPHLPPQTSPVGQGPQDVAFGKDS